MGAHLSRRGLVLGLLLASFAAVVLYALGARALERQQRADVLAGLQEDASRIAWQVRDRWPELRWGNESCAMLEPTLMAVWRRDGVELCRSAFVAHYYESVLKTLVPKALAQGSAEFRSAHREQPYGDVPYVAWAVPVTWEGEDVAAVVVSASITPPEIALTALRWGVLSTWLIACAAVLLTERRRRKRLQRVFGAATAELAALVPDGSSADGALVAATLTPAPAEEAWSEHLHALAERAAHRHEALRERLEQREAVLASMVEGVLAVDPGGRLIDLNPAAAEMFGLRAADARGRDLLEVLRHPELQRFVREALTSPVPVERELTLYEPEPRTLQVRGASLHGADHGAKPGRGLGTLLVLHDVTRLRRLERLRQDFVANVSHELRTPITSIKGFVETLQDGAVDDPESARRFLDIVARHTERLHAITEDLLSLSRIEQEAERGVLHTEDTRLADVLSAVASLCAEAAGARNIQVETHCDPDLRAQVNPQLVEQALVNLVGNAAKFAPEGSTVRVTGAAQGGMLALSVRDEGPGIPAEHLPRLFERFYRVDKGRTRGAGSPGGTGLGLAIVKHIAQAHGGRVEVASRLGEGSTFTVLLPMAPPPADGP